MTDVLQTALDLYRNIRWLDVVDILVVAYLFYRILVFIRDTRSLALLRGLGLLALIFVLSTWFPALNMVLQVLIPVAIIALVIIFQPELRLGLERLGRGGLLPGVLTPLQAEGGQDVVNEVVDTAERLSEKGHGALIVLQRTEPLVDIARTGKAINGRLSVELLMTIFNPRTPLHDGAVVIRGSQILAASCVLPHSERPGLSTETGMRHRAALGLAERTDAAVVVVSEETGNISLAVNGTLSPALQRPQLTERLLEMFEAQTEAKRFFFWRK
jgi:diadenylate cyclase